MNVLVQKFGPPVVVLGVAFYLGSPPAAPLDLGEDIVKASTVRWKKDDLKSPVVVRQAVNPFKQVLVASEEMEVEPETGKLVVSTKPAGPDPAEIRAGLSLSGVANMGGQKWAVINGKPRLPGDTLKIKDAKQRYCTVVSVGDDHAVVSCQDIIVQIRPTALGIQKLSEKFMSVSKPTAVINGPAGTPADEPNSGAVSPAVEALPPSAATPVGTPTDQSNQPITSPLNTSVVAPPTA